MASCPQWATVTGSKAWCRLSTDLPWRGWPCRAPTGSRLMNGRASRQTGQRRRSLWGITQQRHTLCEGRSLWSKEDKCGIAVASVPFVLPSKFVGYYCSMCTHCTVRPKLCWRGCLIQTEKVSAGKKSWVLVQPDTNWIYFVCPLISTVHSILALCWTAEPAGTSFHRQVLAESFCSNVTAGFVKSKWIS